MSFVENNFCFRVSLSRNLFFRDMIILEWDKIINIIKVIIYFKVNYKVFWIEIKL